jgi:hypothetical protein
MKVPISSLYSTYIAQHTLTFTRIPVRGGSKRRGQRGGVLGTACRIGRLIGKHPSSMHWLTRSRKVCVCVCVCVYVCICVSV